MRGLKTNVNLTSFWKSQGDVLHWFGADIHVCHEIFRVGIVSFLAMINSGVFVGQVLLEMSEVEG